MDEEHKPEEDKWVECKKDRGLLHLPGFLRNVDFYQYILLPALSIIAAAHGFIYGFDWWHIVPVLTTGFLWRVNSFKDWMNS